jgi:hypothetical protein
MRGKTGGKFPGAKERNCRGFFDESGEFFLTNVQFQKNFARTVYPNGCMAHAAKLSAGRSFASNSWPCVRDGTKAEKRDGTKAN